MSNYWKPSISVNGERSKEDVVAVSNQHKALPLSQQRTILPIFKHRKTLLYAIEKNAVVVLVGETGSGKSTQLPLYLFEAGWLSPDKGVIICQPRRLAATNLATRVAQELGVNIGDEVGYAVRFDSKISSKTVIRYVTDGLLLRYLLADPLLGAYNVIIVDEAHERSLHSDVLLGLLKKIRRKRHDLKIIITSATINAQGIKDFFDSGTIPPAMSGLPNQTSCIVSIEGRTHPVDVLYLEAPVQNYLRAIADCILKIHRQEGKGDILVFLTGGEDIDAMVELLKDMYEGPDLITLPLYGSLPASAQMLAFQKPPANCRKCILATNIAETSVTIEGIRFVIDSGFAKLNYFDVRSGIDSLLVCPISQASAMQRSGRAGRTQPGKCFRMYTEREYQGLAPFTVPEMQRSDISWAVLELKALGIADVLHFDFISPPSADSLCHALELLYSLGALDGDCNLTAFGGKMAEMPVEPRLSRCLLMSFELGCVEEMLSVAAMCDVDYPFVTLRSKASDESKQRLADSLSQFVSLEGDHITLLNIFKGFVAFGYSSSWAESMMLNSRILLRAKEVSYLVRT